MIEKGGQILKFIGDGLLAVFPVTEGGDEVAAATDAVAAAEQALLNVDALNREAPETLDRIDGWRPLRSGIALHMGEVFFGNMGAPERLDFTVIGRAVNEVSRVEALTKELGRPVLVSEPVPSPGTRTGEHGLPSTSRVLRTGRAVRSPGSGLGVTVTLCTANELPHELS